MEDFDKFDDVDSFDFETKKKSKIKIPKIKITKKQIFAFGLIIIFLAIAYLYIQYLTPKHIEINCKTNNGYSFSCPPYDIKGKNGNIITGNDLIPGKYTLVIHDSPYHSGITKPIEIGTEPKQEITEKLSGIDIEYIDTNVSVYPKLRGNIKIVLYNPYSKAVPYKIELIGKNGYYKKIEGRVIKKDQVVYLSDIFCKSTQKICLGKKDHLTYTLKIKYGDISTQKKVNVYILPDIKISRFEGSTTIKLEKGKTLEKIYSVKLYDKLPKPVFNVSVNVTGIEPFILNISKTKIDLYPGTPVDFKIIYKYEPGTQKKYEGYIKLKKDLFEYSKKIIIDLKE